MSAKKSATKTQQPKVEELHEEESVESPEIEEAVVEKPAVKKAPAKKVAATPVVEKKAPAKPQPVKNAVASSSETKTPVAKKAPAAKNAKVAEKKTPVKNSKAASNSSEETEETVGSGIRYFKILADKIIPQKGSPVIPASELSFKGGRFKGRNPMQAAKKAFTGLCKAATKLGYEGECSYIFTIQETSQGSHKKEFPYSGERLKLSTPQKVVKDNTEYFVSFSSTVRSYKTPVVEDSTPKQESSSNVEKKNVPAKKAPNKKSVTIKTPEEKVVEPEVVVEQPPVVVEQPQVVKKNPPAKTTVTPKQAPKKK
jgi:hypothetical protein